MQRSKLLLCSVALTACAAAAPIAQMLSQMACNIVPIVDPSSKQTVASVCADVVPDVAPLVNAVSSLAGSGDAKPCKLVPITPDGVTGFGEACDFECGDMSRATAQDPCPDIDAKLRVSAAAKALAARRSR